jgi:hypothetical protein
VLSAFLVLALNGAAPDVEVEASGASSGELDAEAMPALACAGVRRLAPRRTMSAVDEMDVKSIDSLKSECSELRDSTLVLYHTPLCGGCSRLLLKRPLDDLPVTRTCDASFALHCFPALFRFSPIVIYGCPLIDRRRCTSRSVFPHLHLLCYHTAAITKRRRLQFTDSTLWYLQLDEAE